MKRGREIGGAMRKARRVRHLQRAVQHVNKAVGAVVSYQEASGLKMEEIVRDLLDARQQLLYQANVIENSPFNTSGEVN